jgi:hypothetical protein
MSDTHLTDAETFDCVVIYNDGIEHREAVRASFSGNIERALMMAIETLRAVADRHSDEREYILASIAKINAAKEGK